MTSSDSATRLRQSGLAWLEREDHRPVREPDDDQPLASSMGVGDHVKVEVIRAPQIKEDHS